jgi:3-keto-L-gulonate-6-phosphate decarboxylase
LFSYISINWRGKPLNELLTIINLIASTTIAGGLKVECISDTQQYQKGIIVSDKALAAVNIKQQEFHGEWNYIVFPNL